MSATLTPHELAAHAAGALLLDDARRYGMTTGGPVVDRARCEEILQRLARRRIWPSAEERCEAAIRLAGLKP